MDLDQRQIRNLDGKNLNQIMADMKMGISFKSTNKIDPATGDVNLLDMTIEVIKGNEETTLKGWPIQ